MNIIVCNDQRTESFPENFNRAVPDVIREVQNQREKINIDARLIERLRRTGHEVSLFDGYREDGVTKMRSAQQAGNVLAELITTEEASGLVFDLHYFNDFSYGITMLKQLRKTNSLPVDMQLVVYSRFFREPEGDYPRRLVEECGVPLKNVVDRNKQTIDFIVDLFKEKPTP